MLDVREELRGCHPDIRPEASTDDLAAIVVDQMEWLEGKLDRCLIALDLAERDMVAAGMPLEEDAETRRLRKQEGKVKLDFRKAKAELLESRAQAAAAAATAADPASAPPPPTPPPPPVAKTIRTDRKETAPTPRPNTSNAACKYLKSRSMLEAFELPATATSPAKRVDVRLPFPGGDPEPQPESESEPESDDIEAETDVVAEPVILTEPAAVRPQPAHVACQCLAGGGCDRSPREGSESSGVTSRRRRARPLAAERR